MPVVPSFLHYTWPLSTFDLVDLLPLLAIGFGYIEHAQL